MTPYEIQTELENRNEKLVRFNEDGSIVSTFGRFTRNTWIINEQNKLECIDVSSCILEQGKTQKLK